MEYRVKIYNRASFRIFLDMNIVFDVHDRNTIWKSRERFANNGLKESLFEEFNAFLSNKGLIVTGGAVGDAAFVDDGSFSLFFLFPNSFIYRNF